MYRFNKRRLNCFVFVFLVSLCSLATADQTYTPSGAEPDPLYAKLIGDQALFLRNFYNGVDARFAFAEDAVFVEFSNGIAEIHGCLIDQVNPANEMCGTLNLLSKHSQPVGSKMPLKKLKSTAYATSGGPVSPLTWNYYFVNASNFIGQNALDGAVIQFTPKKAIPEFQIGTGANGKNILYGFTGSMKYKVTSQPFTSRLYLKGKADLNVQLDAIVPPPPPPPAKKGHIITTVTVEGGATLSTFYVTTGEGYVPFSLYDGESNDQELAAGTYSVRETDIVGWNSLGICFDSDDNFVNPASIVLEENETISCRYFNFMNSVGGGPQMGHIVTFKETHPDGIGQTFTFRLGDPYYFQLTDGGTNISIGLLPTFGTERFSVIEYPTDGWTLTTAVCTNGTDWNINPNSFTLAARETVACLFVNTFSN